LHSHSITKHSQRYTYLTLTFTLIFDLDLDTLKAKTSHNFHSGAIEIRGLSCLTPWTLFKAIYNNTIFTQITL